MRVLAGYTRVRVKRGNGASYQEASVHMTSCMWPCTQLLLWPQPPCPEIPVPALCPQAPPVVEEPSLVEDSALPEEQVCSWVLLAQKLGLGLARLGARVWLLSSKALGCQAQC